jgi:anionic cell wall polymer biosynthesis LytR-Cps2A-Psr (LCP) family protein
MKALITLNDTIGGVTLTSSMTFTSPIDGRTIQEGETVTLHGKEADYYVRHRDTEKLESNNERMVRQQEYIRAFLKSIIPAAKNDISVVSKLYNEIKVNSETSLDLAKITYIASMAVTKLRNASDIQYVNLKGPITKGEYAEMHVTNEETLKTMLSVFYKPLAQVPNGLKN